MQMSPQLSEAKTCNFVYKSPEVKGGERSLQREKDKDFGPDTRAFRHCVYAKRFEEGQVAQVVRPPIE